VGHAALEPAMRTAAIIEYGIGNIGSVVEACRRVGMDIAIASNGTELLEADAERIILPGVGAIDAALDLLRQRGFMDVLSRLVVAENRPFLGICVGMQVMARRCTEFGDHAGLGWITGDVTRLAEKTDDLRLPHVGWNEIEATHDDPLLAGVDGECFYFVHSCGFRSIDAADVIAQSDYGRPFAVAVRRGNRWGVQFHPEKSSMAGERLLANFMAVDGV
jgi:imidazole glycerol-phosphate synthase subunit HisH